jgi:peptide/nickel transport system permease protein
LSTADREEVAEVEVGTDPTSLSVIARRVLRHPAGLIGAVLVTLFLFVVLFAPNLLTHDPVAQDLMRRNAQPSAENWFGTDQLGRDIYSRVISGSRTSLLLGVSVVAVGAIVGTVLGVVGGYLGGRVDGVIMRIADLFMAFPKIVLAMAVAAVLGPSVRNTVMAVAVTWWPDYARLSRSTAISTKQAIYVEAAKVLGVRPGTIIRRHIVPPTIGTVLVKGAMDVGFAIVYVAGLSFIGLGVQPPLAEWGVMVSGGRSHITQAWWIAGFPGLAILLAALSFNLFGEALRDVFDSRSGTVR